MKQYQDLVKRIYDEGEFKPDRTGTGTYSVFGHQMRFDLRKGFPLVTTKFTPIATIIRELLWFRDGLTNINDPIFGGSKIWDEWALPEDYVIEEDYTIDDILRMYAKRQKISLDSAIKEYRGVCVTMSRVPVPVEALKGTPSDIVDELYALDPADDKKVAGHHDRFTFAVQRANETFRNRLGLAPHAKKKVVVKEKGSIGPMYGFIWRNFGGVDQLKEVIEKLRVNPNSRRHLVSAWDPSKLPDETKSPHQNIRDGKGALAPCHAFFQFNAIEIRPVDRANYFNELFPQQAVDLSNYLDRDGEEKFPGAETSLSVVLDNKKAPTHWLDLQLYMRSCDVGLGLPFNIASYALLLSGIAHELNYAPRHYVHTTGDTHIYSNHLTKLQEVLVREPYAPPRLKINRPVGTSFFDLKEEDFELVGYKSHEKIHLPISV